MRKIVAGLFISLDGVVEAPETWHFPYFNDEMGEIVGAQMAAADTLLFGRRTYEEFAAYWPAHADDPFGAQINAAAKVVVSTTLKDVTWENTSLISGTIGEEVRRLKEGPGKDISITGSPTLVRSLLRDGLLDELQLLVHPIVIGSGKRLFDGDDRVPLKLTGSRTLTTGVLHLTYAPADA